MSSHVYLALGLRDGLPVMDPEPHYHLTQALGYLMSDASEELWCMQWPSDQAEQMPALLLSGTATGLDPANVALMLAIAKGLGHWCDWEWYEQGEQYVPYLPKCVRAEGG